MAPNKRGGKSAHCRLFQLWKADYFVNWNLHLLKVLEKWAGALSAHFAAEKTENQRCREVFLLNFLDITKHWARIQGNVGSNPHSVLGKS